MYVDSYYQKLAILDGKKISLNVILDSQKLCVILKAGDYRSENPLKHG